MGESGEAREGWSVSSTQVRCVAQAHAQGTVGVEVSGNGVDFHGSAVRYEYVSGVQVRRVVPSLLDAGGGATVTVEGANFGSGSNMECLIGRARSSLAHVSSSLVVCTVPGHVVGNVTVDVVSDGEAGSLSTESVFVASPASMTSFRPTFGVATGGTVVEVSGSNFVFERDLFCVFGGKRVRSSWVSAHLVKCVTPGGLLGRVKISLESEKRMLEHMGGDEFEFVSALQVQVTALHPSTASVRGGLLSVVVGRNFLPGSTHCLVGGGRLVSEVLTSSSMECTMPAHSAGSVEVEVGGVSGESSPDRVMFVYEAAPTVSGVVPGTLYVNGGSMVTVLGSHFKASSDARCRFGEEEVSTAAWQTSSAVLCSAPSISGGSIGKLAVEVSNNGLEYITAEDLLEVSLSIAIGSVVPSRASMQGRVRITVLGEFKKHDWSCGFGEERVVALESSISMVVCEVPAGREPGVVDFDIGITGSPTRSASVGFEYLELWDVFSVWPSVGPTGVSSVLNVKGRNFAISGIVSCRIGGYVTEGDVVSSSEVRCLAPKREAGVVKVEVSNNGVEFVGDSARYEYVAEFEVTSFSPTSGPAVGGTTVYVSGGPFEDGLSFVCAFGEERVEAYWLGPDRLKCKTGAHVPGNVTVGVGRGEGGVMILNTSFWYLPGAS
eukprot:3941508-Rhodomonas_salina.1